MSSGLVNGSLVVVPLTVKVCDRVFPDRIVNAVSEGWGEGWSPPAGATAGRTATASAANPETQTAPTDRGLKRDMRNLQSSERVGR